MKLRKAFFYRITELCEQNNISFYELGKRAGIPKTTLQSIKDGTSASPGLSTIQKIADGFEMSVRDFFCSELFD